MDISEYEKKVTEAAKELETEKVVTKPVETVNMTIEMTSTTTTIVVNADTSGPAVEMKGEMKRGSTFTLKKQEQLEVIFLRIGL